jgi:hypothetical protein
VNRGSGCGIGIDCFDAVLARQIANFGSRNLGGVNSLDNLQVLFDSLDFF